MVSIGPCDSIASTAGLSRVSAALRFASDTLVSTSSKSCSIFPAGASPDPPAAACWSASGVSFFAMVISRFTSASVSACPSKTRRLHALDPALNR